MHTNIPKTTRSQLTDRYISDLELRISQEMLLGIGGVRALEKLGYNPTIYHMNEGHSAFLALERIRNLISKGSSFSEAESKVRQTNIFTTHTPVPAGNDEFPIWLIEKYFSNYWPELGMNRDEFLSIAKVPQTWGGEAFSMPVLALRLSDFKNGVSELHGEVSRKMWSHLWPDRDLKDVPISYNKWYPHRHMAGAAWRSYSRVTGQTGRRMVT